MPTATVKVDYVNQPKEGAKQGSIKTTDGAYYGVYPNQLNLFEKGGSYQIEYTSREYNGKTYKTVSKVLNGAGKGGGDAKAQEMFVMGIIGRSLQGTGKIPEASVLTSWVRTARTAWEKGFKNEPEPEIEPDPEEFDDPLPF